MTDAWEGEMKINHLLFAILDSPGMPERANKAIAEVIKLVNGLRQEHLISAKDAASIIERQADEIDRLREALQDIVDNGGNTRSAAIARASLSVELREANREWDYWNKETHKARAEIERLREALESILAIDPECGIARAALEDQK